MLKASITVTDNGLIAKSFIPEDKVIKDKASYKVVRKGKTTVFELTAANSTDLRTVLNSITKMLTVIEKMKGIK